MATTRTLQRARRAFVGVRRLRYSRGMSDADAAVADPTAPVLPDAKMHVAMPTAPVAARIAGSRLCMKGKSASFIRHVEIDGAPPGARTVSAG